MPALLVPQLWRLGAAALSSALGGVMFLFDPWWCSALGSLFLIVAVVFGIRFAVTVLIAPMMGGVTQLRISLQPQPTLHFPLSSLRVAEIRGVDFSPDGAIRVHREGAAPMQFSLPKSDFVHGSELALWLNQLAAASDPNSAHAMLHSA